MRKIFADLWDERTAVILALSLLVAVIIYCLGTRYRFVSVNQRGYMYDRITGKSWHYLNNNYFPVMPINPGK
jgi:hypothetical protein